jgi:hypothetical protein
MPLAKVARSGLVWNLVSEMVDIGYPRIVAYHVHFPVFVIVG